jgi:hypothetical protein
MLTNYSLSLNSRPKRSDVMPKWCICGYCVDTPDMKNEERKCCRRQICITRTERCRNVCLDNDIIRAANNGNADVRARVPGYDNRNLRHVSYRQYVMWQHGHLGKNNRVVIPSCVIWLIRRKWPSPDGRYTGFLPPRRQNNVAA